MARAKAGRQPGPRSGDESAPLLERDGMISKDELAVFLDVPAPTLDYWASKGGGPEYYGIGNHRKYLPADVRAWLATRKRGVASDASRAVA
jgi:helix-turn-helix protein